MTILLYQELPLPLPRWDVYLWSIIIDMVDIRKAGGILIKDRKFLVVRQKDKDFFIAPGGKLIENETPIEALIRELIEEICVEVQPHDLTEFGVFTAPAAGAENKLLQMNVYLVNRWQGEIVINENDRVCEFRWIDSNDLRKIKLGSIFEHEVLPRLKNMNLID